ncbi:MAG: nitroreductase family protein, partial [Sedimentisphaerales bacterium]
MPDPDKINSALKKLINHRSSIREYQDAAISKDELSYLLWCTQGVKEKVGNIHTLRTVPSAGARHALETFILVNKVDGLRPGLYRYLALKHKIQEFIISDVIFDKVTHGCLGQEFVKESA